MQVQSSTSTLVSLAGRLAADLTGAGLSSQGNAGTVEYQYLPTVPTVSLAGRLAADLTGAGLASQGNAGTV